MFTLKCEYWVFEQIIKKRLDKYTYYELTHCKHLWCSCNKCKGEPPRPRPVGKGFVKHGWVLGEWDWILTEEDAAYVQPHQNYGSWSKIINPTIEGCKALLRAKKLGKIGIQLSKEKSNGTT
ncbi:MAG: hypothetical protein E7256_17110 [Lachnospiraceae bacterium]|nr:hypothetical protein [Lachnospiraceae bacterium]